MLFSAVRGRPPTFLMTDAVSRKFFTHKTIDFRYGIA